MKHLLKLFIAILAIGLFSCNNPAKTGKSTADYQSPEFAITELHDSIDSVMLRIAFIGDAEPKPLAEFPNMSAAVDQINAFGQTNAIDFVIGVGDIAHKGTEIQYEAATPVLQKLQRPFYPIMGNEEHGNSVEKFVHYANQWNSQIVSPSYVVNHEKVAFIFASPDEGREFDDTGAGWILSEMQRLAPKPVFLIVHGAQKGVYPENSEKGIGNDKFRNEVIKQTNLVAVISGDLHMDMDRVDHSKKIENVHYMHIPALERTKIPDETRHVPMVRIMTILKSGKVNMDTYVVGEDKPRTEHAYTFNFDLK
jgi:3',5'-cyclic-AMP phosphodiesterase